MTSDARFEDCVRIFANARGEAFEDLVKGGSRAIASYINFP